MTKPLAEEQQVLKSEEEGRRSMEEPRGILIDSTPPVLPEPQVDNAFSIESVLDATVKHNEEEMERLQKLKEENDKLDAQIKAMNDRLAAAEKRTEEMEAKRRSQVF